MKRRILAMVGAAALLALAVPAISAEEAKPEAGTKEVAKLTPELVRALTEKALALQDRATASKELLADLKATVEKHRAELLGALSGGAVLERALAASLLHLATSDQDKIAEALAKALADEDLDVRRGAAAGLLALKKPATADALIKALEDSDEQVRAAVAAALGSLKAVKARPGLEKLLTDATWLVRLQAVQALSAIADKDSSKEIADKIKDLLEDENAFVRMAAAGAVTRLTGVKPEGTADQPEKNILHKLASQMSGAKDELDAERCGAPVQVAQKDIADKLDAIIKMIQEQQQQQQQPKPGEGKPKEGEKKPGEPKSGPGNQGKPGQGKQGGQKPTSPMSGEFMTEGGVQHGAKAEISGFGAEWGNLPPKVREEMLQGKAESFPEHYRELLRIYLMGIAEEANR